MLRKIEVRYAINMALDELLSRNDEICLLGEEIGETEGAYGITKNLYKKYGNKRIIDMPICEAGFSGLAVGAAMGGLFPVVEFMNMNFSYQAIDQILNSAGKIPFITNEKIKLNIIFRGPHGYNIGGGPEHSDDFSSFFSKYDLKVFAPYTVVDHLTVYKHAEKTGGVYVILENIQLYSMKFPLPLNIGMNYSSYIMREGWDITLISHSYALSICENAAEQLEQESIECEIVNLLSLNPIKYDAIITSIIKTKLVIIVDFDRPKFSIGNEISNFIYENYSYILKDKIKKINAKDSPVPFSTDSYYPTTDTLVREIKKIIKN